MCVSWLAQNVFLNKIGGSRFVYSLDESEKPTDLVSVSKKIPPSFPKHLMTSPMGSLYHYHQL